MSAITSTIQLRDSASSILNTINETLGTVIGNMERLDTATNNAGNNTSLNNLQSSIQGVANAWNTVLDTENLVDVWNFNDASNKAEILSQRLAEIEQRQLDISSNTDWARLPDGALNDIEQVENRLGNLQTMLASLNDMNVDLFDESMQNTTFTQIRQNLNEISNTQREINQAASTGNVNGLNSGYRRLNNLVNSTENIIQGTVEAINREQEAISQAEQESGRLRQIIEEIRNVTDEVRNSQEQYNDSLRNGNTNADSLLGTVKKLAGAYLSLKTVQDLVEASDTITMGKQKLGMVLDEKGLDSSASAVEEMNKKILQSANYARTSYTDMVAQVGKLGLNAGNAFNNTDEIIAFVEQFDKLAAIGGASVYESSQAMYQLTQSMAKGKLDGDELRSVMEGMPQVAKTIADYLGTDVGHMKELAADGQVTADVVKNALLANIDETNQKIDNLSYTWQQQINILKNGAMGVADDVMSKINELANNQGMANIFLLVGSTIKVAGAAVIGFLNVIGFIGDHLNTLAPIILGVAAALAVYNATMGIAWLTTLLDVAANVKKALVSAAETVAIIALTLAQEGFNAALAACPITWIIIGIIALIAVIMALINHFYGASGAANNAFSAICGSVAVMAAFVKNTVVGLINACLQLVYSFSEPFISIVEWILNVANGGFNSFGDAVANLIGQIISWFLSLGQVVTKIIDAIFGTNWTSGLNSLKDKVVAWGKNDNAITLDRTAPTLNVARTDYQSAYDSGAEWGNGVTDKISSNFKGVSIADNSDLLDNISTNTAKTADNSGKIKDSVDISTEELQWLYDIAERDAINKYTTVPLTVNFDNTNNVSNDLDLDGITNHITKQLVEAVNGCAEVVHY